MNPMIVITTNLYLKKNMLYLRHGMKSKNTGNRTAFEKPVVEVIDKPQPKKGFK